MGGCCSTKDEQDLCFDLKRACKEGDLQLVQNILGGLDKAAVRRLLDSTPNRVVNHSNNDNNNNTDISVPHEAPESMEEEKNTNNNIVNDHNSHDDHASDTAISVIIVDNSDTPLHIACRHSHVSIVEHLLSLGANTELTNDDGERPLSIVAETGNEDVCLALLTKAKSPANVECETKKGQTPLMTAALNQNVEVMKLLLRAQANTEHADFQGRTPLHFAILGCQGNDGGSSKSSKVQDVAERIREHTNALAAAAARAHASAQQETGDSKTENENDDEKEENGGDASGSSQQKQQQQPSSRSSASSSSSACCVRLLVESRCNTEVRSKFGVTPLYMCCESNRLEIAANLIRGGSDVNSVREDDGCSCLIAAAIAGHVGMVKLLLKNGCNVDHRMKSGHTAASVLCLRSSSSSSSSGGSSSSNKHHHHAAADIKKAASSNSNPDEEIMKLLLESGCATEGIDILDHPEWRDLCELCESVGNMKMAALISEFAT